MTKTDLICSLIVMIISLITATMYLSDRISERNIEHRNLKTVLALIFSVYSSLGLATFAEYYYSPDFKVWEVFLVGFSLFGAYFVVSVTIGLCKMKKDERERWRKKFGNIGVNNHHSEDNSCMVTQKNIAERANDYQVANNCCRIMSIEDAKKRRKARK